MNKLKVVYLDGEEQEAVAGARAEVEFERRFNMAFTDAFRTRSKGEPRSRQEWAYYFAWASLRIEDSTIDSLPDDQAKDKQFQEWLRRVDSVEYLGGAEDPTKRARRPANSSSSAS